MSYTGLGATVPCNYDVARAQSNLRTERQYLADLKLRRDALLAQGAPTLQSPGVVNSSNPQQALATAMSGYQYKLNALNSDIAERQQMVDYWAAQVVACGGTVPADTFVGIADPSRTNGFLDPAKANVDSAGNLPVAGYTGRAVQFEYNGSVAFGGEGLYRITAYRVMTVNNGVVSYGGWSAVGPWIVRLSGSEVAQSVLANGWGSAVRASQSVPMPPAAQWPEAVTMGEAAAKGFLQTLPFSVTAPSTWSYPLGSHIVSAPASTVPYIPGSTYDVPAGGTGGTTMVKLPGSQEWTDATALSPEQITAAKQAGAQVVSSRGGGMDAPSLDFGGDGNGVTAGEGGLTKMSTLLLLGGAAFLLFAGKKRGRR